MFIKPMLASPLKPGFILEPGKFAVEEKIDGIRIICEVSKGSQDLFTHSTITPWSRYEKIHPLPSHVVEEMAKFPYGIYDGEIYIPGKRSYGATELKNLPDMSYAIFDILELKGENTTNLRYATRRLVLRDAMYTSGVEDGPVHLLGSTLVNTMDEVYALRDAVWARDGEGLILKRLAAPYQPGKRSKDFIKIKDLKSAVLTVIGFMPSRGLLNDRGPCAMIMLRDDEGNETTVKTRNDAECLRLAKLAKDATTHPEIGRKLRIEYQERTPDGNYRHPRADRWENE